ncbi:MAG TPA: CDP-alcohol phosphatidyltransferase family protein [Stellaceae bacterium]
MSHDTWAHRIVRPVVRRLATTSTTPNQLTTLRLLTAIAAALLLATGDRGLSILGGAIFLVSFFLDRADGDLARLSGRSSAWGHRFDLCADYTANILVFVGIGFGLQEGALGSSSIALGAVAGSAIVLIFWLVRFVERVEGSAVFPSAGGFDADDAMVVIPLSIWLDGEMYILVAAAIGAPTFFGWSVWRFRKALSQLSLTLREDRASRNH